MHSGLIGGFPRDIALKDKLNQAFRALLTVWNQYRPHIYAGGIVFVIPRNAVFFHRIVHIGERICRKEKYLVLCKQSTKIAKMPLKFGFKLPLSVKLNEERQRSRLYRRLTFKACDDFRVFRR